MADSGALERDVPGLAELNRFLETFPTNLATKVLRGALRAAQKPIADAAKAGAPVAVPGFENRSQWGAKPGSLRDSVKIYTGLDKKSGRVIATLRAGNKVAFYARFVEFGTAAHIIRAKNHGALQFNGHEAAYVHHPGSRANPFMRIAIDANVQKGIDAFVGYLRARISKELDRLADEVDG